MSDDPIEDSPVPSDAHLWPDEQPFTAWGQHPHGTLDLRVFDQDVWWVDIEQQPHRLAEMSVAHLDNVIAHLLANVDSFYYATVRRLVITRIGESILDLPPAPVGSDATVSSSQAGHIPLVWLEQTTLMRGLIDERATRPS
ncbi:hypothetical protein [Janibacter melonis]|uniref:hypothetical protein n=1 Tax=Janibacter melonis TaxID=262209 RepID=UPI00191AA541|nr:hypothetical protein [Janibacter melonis]